MHRLIRIFIPVLAALTIGASAGAAEEQNIAEVATAAGTFETLLAAATAAGLVPALTGEGPLTVFAPTDAAFAKLPKGTVESLLEPANRDKLAAILKFHVLAGAVPSSAVRDGLTAASLQGGELTFTVQDDVVRVNGAQITAVDINASNGVIHVIDTVLLPPAKATKSQASTAAANSSCGGN
jgi:uncharacterized surface protein with fasciclin (FAS1) repeats